MVIPILSHRIMVKQEAMLNNKSTEDILYSILDKIDVPVVA